MNISDTHIYEVIGVHFTNCYWTGLYHKAIELVANEKYANIDEAYKVVLQSYVSAFSIDNGKNNVNRNYIVIIEGLYKDFKKYTGFTDSFQKFIDLVVKTCVNDNLTNTKKDEIFRKIMVSVITKFTIYVQDHAQKVITADIRKKEAVNITTEWKNMFISIFIQERNKFNAMLMAAKNGVKINEDTTLIEKNSKLQILLQKAIRNEADIIKKYNIAVKAVEHYRNNNVILNKRLMELEGRYREIIESKRRNRSAANNGVGSRSVANNGVSDLNNISGNPNNDMNITSDPNNYMNTDNRVARTSINYMDNNATDTDYMTDKPFDISGQNNKSLDDFMDQVEAPPDDILRELDNIADLVPDE